MILSKKSTPRYKRRINRTRKKILSVAQEGSIRICFMRSNKHLYAQVIDSNGVTILGASTVGIESDTSIFNYSNKKYASLLADKLYKGFDKIKDKIENRVLYFDRGPNRYSLVIDAFIKSMFKNGIKI